jgi:hypothetical protein
VPRTYAARALESRRNPAWLELVQLVPIVTLALPFIVAGGVDLSRASGGLLAGALLTVPVTALVVWRRGVLNPILLGTAAWLWFGALAFTVPIPPLEQAVRETQGFGLFVAIVLAGVVTTLFSPHGFIGCRHGDRRFVRNSSLALLALGALALAWSFYFRDNVRLGGGLPFIVLNVARRLLVRRAPPPRPPAPTSPHQSAAPP